MIRNRFAVALALAILVVFALSMVPGVVQAKKPPPPPPPSDPDPAIAYWMDDDLMVMNADGSNQTIVLGEAGTLHGGVDWSPDATQLVFTSNIQGNGIYVIDVDGTDLTKIVGISTSLLTRPAWSPQPVPGDGDDEYRIAYCAQPEGGARTDLYIVCPDGSDPVRLTSTGDNGENYPTWSPSGDKLAVTAAVYLQNDLWALYDFDLDTYTVDQHEDFLEGALVNQPSWSKTQDDKIAWRYGTADASGVGVVDLGDTANPLLLSDSEVKSESYPSWSPDDLRIVYNGALYKGNKLKGWAIKVMDPDGTNAETIQTGGSGPVWRR